MPSNTPIPPDEAKRRLDKTIKEAHELYERRLRAWENYKPRKRNKDDADAGILGENYYKQFISGISLGAIAKSEGYKDTGPVCARIWAFLDPHFSQEEFLNMLRIPGMGRVKIMKHFAKILQERQQQSMV